MVTAITHKVGRPEFDSSYTIAGLAFIQESTKANGLNVQIVTTTTQLIKPIAEIVTISIDRKLMIMYETSIITDLLSKDNVHCEFHATTN